jgi:pimeloyl-ACP methyl ester carboxylesterase
MAAFVVVHGAWSAGWAWKKMRPLLRKHGHELFTPTHTGLGERSHLARPDVDLESHIADVLNVLAFEDLKNDFLLAHSYGGMVATGVADRAPERIAQLIYLDAFVPRDGQSVTDLAGGAAGHARLVAAAREHGDGWRLPPNPMPPDTAAEDLAWASPLRMMQPLKTFEHKLRLSGAVDRIPRHYVYCTRPGPGDVFRQFTERARHEAGWRYFELDASHNPHITMPGELAALLHGIAAGAPPAQAGA